MRTLLVTRCFTASKTSCCWRMFLKIYRRLPRKVRVGSFSLHYRLGTFLARRVFDRERYEEANPQPLELFCTTKYVLHHKNLHQYLKHGMKLTKIQRGVAYSKSMFLKEFISNNTESRKVAKNDFEKDFFKLMNNSVFGKTMENVRERLKIVVVSGLEEEKPLRLVAKPNFREHTPLKARSLFP